MKNKKNSTLNLRNFWKEFWKIFGRERCSLQWLTFWHPLGEIIYKPFWAISNNLQCMDPFRTDPFRTTFLTLWKSGEEIHQYRFITIRLSVFKLDAFYFVVKEIKYFWLNFAKSSKRSSFRVNNFFSREYFELIFEMTYYNITTRLYLK